MGDPTTGGAAAKAAVFPALGAVKCSLTFCCNRGDYFADLKRNLSSLGEQKHELEQMKKLVKSQVDEERKKDPRMKEAGGVAYWLDRVKEMEVAVTKVKKEGDEELQKKCKRWLCPKNCCAFNEVGRLVSTKVGDVKELVEKGRQLSPLVERKACSPVDEWQIGFEPLRLESRLEEAWRCMEDPSVKIIGILGREGAGKTILLKTINNELLGNGLGFDVVIRAVLSKDGTVKKVQASILDKLEVPREEKSEDVTATKILEVLRTKKFVLLLDDLREQSNQNQASSDSSFIQKQEDLINVGVPVDGNSNGSKVFFTTRSMAVCNRMKADKIIAVDYLSTNESLKLLQSCAGEEMLNNPKIKGLASPIAEMSHGMPFALVVFGQAMAHSKNLKQLNNAMKYARRHRSNYLGMKNDIFHVLKISYDSLSNDKIKQCFLYFSVFPEATAVKKEDLIEQWLNEGFLGESYDINHARTEGEDIIESLNLAGLIEIDDSGEHLSLRDVIRSMASWLCSTSRNESAVKMFLAKEQHNRVPK